MDQKPTRSLPIKHVIGVIDQLQEAEQAIQSLQDAGYAAQDVHLFPSQVFVETMQQKRQQISSFGRALHVVMFSNDDGFHGDLYLHQAQRGAHILAVYASAREQEQEIAKLLHTYHGHHVKYIGQWTVTDYPSSAGL
jgi:hypothetical protein